MSAMLTDDRDAAYSIVNDLADWSDWQPFFDAALDAPLMPGVYQMRLRDGLIVYVGMARERRGQGIRGRLSMYRRGKGAVSGFGEAALDRALADADFIEEHLARVRTGQPARTAVWAQNAIRWFDVEVRWVECDTGKATSVLENAAIELLLVHGIWNRVAVKATRAPTPVGIVIELAAGLGVSNLTTVARLTDELGLDDGGRAVRRALRKGFPDHRGSTSWDPLAPAHVAYVRAQLGRLHG
ncbi:hypothetical protein [Microbacterium sp. SLBN-111]|uniref:hypothetical protein n=1 Tax=Microbacterium sp. SLBN-111 TaxID=3377733 RepID=UPI003C7691FC